MKIKSKKYIKKKYKSNKNTMKYRKSTKSIKLIKCIKRNRKSKKMKGGMAAISKMATKVPGVGDLSKISAVPKKEGPGPIESKLIEAKGMAMNHAPSLKALPSPMGGLSKIASSAGDSLKKMVPTSKELSQALPKKPTSGKDVGALALSMAKKPVVIPWRLTMAILKSMRNVITATLVVPTLSINQIITPSLCKYYLKNDRICAQTISEYIFKGSRPDFSKRKLTDEEKCIELNPDTNKYEQCKPAKMKGGGKKNELIITCKENVHHGLYKNDRVMVYHKLPLIANKLGENVYIGKILSISGPRNEHFEIKLENSTEEPIKVEYIDNDPNIIKYDKKFQSFLSEFKKYFQNMYKNNIKWSKKSNENLNLFLVASLFTLLGALAIPTIIGLAAALGISVVAAIGTKKVVEVIGIKFPILLFELSCKIYVKIAESKTRQAAYLAMMKRIIDDDKVKSEKKNLYILKQLIKINNHLRLYECPKDVLESIFAMIRDIHLLEKIQNIVNQFLEGEKQELEDQEKCDTKYDALKKPIFPKFVLKPDVEYVHIQNHFFNYFRPFYIDPEEENKKESCNKINRLDPLRLLDSFDKTIRGDKDNIAHIVINIFQGISSSNGDIYDNTKEILKNIQCRTDLINIIKRRIEQLEKEKLEKEKLEEEKLEKEKLKKKKLEENAKFKPF